MTISLSIIKRSICSISSPLTHIVNLSITHGIVSDELKIARVIPIFKSGDKALFSNYRPISVLPCFSKFLERIIYNRIINYLNDSDVLCDNQYGFRKTALLALRLSNCVTKFLLHIWTQSYGTALWPRVGPGLLIGRHCTSLTGTWPFPLNTKKTYLMRDFVSHLSICPRFAGSAQSNWFLH